MTTNLKTLVLYCFLLLLSLRLVAQGELEFLSLEELIQLTQAKSIQGKEARYNLELAQLNYQNYRASLKPQLSGNANFPNYSKTFSETTQPNGTILFQPIVNNNSALGLSLTQALSFTGGYLFVDSDLQRFDDFENDQSFYNGLPIRIGIQQPIGAFNPLKWDKKIEPLKLTEAKKQFFLDRESSLLISTRLFFNLLLAQQNLAIAKANKNSNQKLLEIATERFELGKISYNNLLQLQLELAAATKDEQSALQALKNASAEIYTLLGYNYQQQIIQAQMPELKNLEIELERALQESLSNRAEFVNHQRLLLESDRDIAKAKGDNGLQASIIASFGFARSAQNLGEIYSDAQQEQLVQLQLNVPIIDWGRKKSAVGIAKAKKDFLQKSIQQEQLNLKTQIHTLIQQFNSLKKEIELVKQVQDIATKRFKISEESFVLGAISITDLSIAQREKDQAVRSYLATLSQYWQTYYELRRNTLYDFQQKNKLIQNKI